MFPINTTRLVRDRTDDLQRTADQVRQERALRSAPDAPGRAPMHAQPAEERRRNASTASGCTPVEPAA